MGLKEATSTANCFQVSSAIICVIFSLPATTVPPPSEEASLKSTPAAFRAAPSAGAWEPAMESPTHSSLVSVCFTSVVGVAFAV